MKKVYTKNAPEPGGHYSQATIHNDTLYVSGILPVEIGCPPDPMMPFRDQVKLVLRHLGEILAEAGSSKAMVLKVSVYVSDIGDWALVNEIYKNFFGDHKPARVIVPVKDLHFGYGIEIDAIAIV